MAYEYTCTEDALAAARDAGVDESKVGMDHESGKYGWQDEESKEDSTVNADNPDEAPAEGLVYLVVSGPILPALASLRGKKMADKLGLTFRVVNSLTFQEVERFAPKARRARSGNTDSGSQPRDERGFTHIQASGIDLMLRPEGATIKEMQAVGALPESAPNARYFQRCLTQISEGRFIAYETGGVDDFRMEMIEVTNKKTGQTAMRGRAAQVYRMRELPEEARAEALAEALAHMPESHRRDKKAENDVPNTNAANDAEKSAEQAA